MANQPNLQSAIDRATSFGVDEATARAVIEAFEKLSTNVDRAFDPAGWSKTVWLAEADRYRRSPSAVKHYDLLFHLHRLRNDWEGKFERGVRGWRVGQVGARLTLR